MTVNDLLCGACGREARTGRTYPERCLCGGLWGASAPDVYALGVPDGVRVCTPLWQDPTDAALVWKREDFNRTGSFKDRGAMVLASVAKQSGAERAVLDSSGSAALAGAAAAAVEGLSLTVHTPANISARKQAALGTLGATLVAEGTRSAAAIRAREESQHAFYLSHVYHPAFREGTGEAALEVMGQTKERPPALWVMPVGNGSLFLGVALALERLQRLDIRLIAVQSEACPGLLRPGSSGDTVAAGIGITDPPRRGEILAAVEQFGGEVIEVSEEAIARADKDLWKRGVAAEITSAVSLAGVRRLREGGESGRILAWLTGSGHRDS